MSWPHRQTCRKHGDVEDRRKSGKKASQARACSRTEPVLIIMGKQIPVCIDPARFAAEVSSFMRL